MADTLRDKFEAWARDHLGQGYPLTMDEDVYEHPVTRWAFKGFVAGRASRPGVKMDPALKAALDEAAKTGATSAMLPGGEAVFINRGHDYGDNGHLECTACGGSGHIDDQRAALASRPAEVDDEGLPPLPDPWHGFQFNSGWNSWEQVSHWAIGDAHVTRAYTEEQFRQGQRDAVAADRARVEKPVAYAVVSKKGGIHKLCITRPSEERKAAVWQEEWPDNGCTVRPLVFGDSEPSHTTNKEK